MSKQFSLIAVIALLLLTSCGSSDSKTETATKTAAEKNDSSNKPLTPGNPTTSPSTYAPAIAVIENENIRFKLHQLIEITPDPTAPGKLAADKRVYAANISVESLQADNTSPAEYMLTSFILDDKGKKHSLPMGSVKLATLVSNAQAEEDNRTGEAFGRSLAAGEKLRGTNYGVEMDANAKPVKWGMILNGKEISVDIK